MPAESTDRPYRGIVGVVIVAVAILWLVFVALTP